MKSIRPCPRCQNDYEIYHGHFCLQCGFQYLDSACLAQYSLENKRQLRHTISAQKAEKRKPLYTFQGRAAGNVPLISTPGNTAFEQGIFVTNASVEVGSMNVTELRSGSHVQTYAVDGMPYVSNEVQESTVTTTKFGAVIKKTALSRIDFTPGQPGYWTEGLYAKIYRPEWAYFGTPTVPLNRPVGWDPLQQKRYAAATSDYFNDPIYRTEGYVGVWDKEIPEDYLKPIGSETFDAECYMFAKDLPPPGVFMGGLLLVMHCTFSQLGDPPPPPPRYFIKSSLSTPGNIIWIEFNPGEGTEVTYPNLHRDLVEILPVTESVFIEPTEPSYSPVYKSEFYFWDGDKPAIKLFELNDPGVTPEVLVSIDDKQYYVFVKYGSTRRYFEVLNGIVSEKTQDNGSWRANYTNNTGNIDPICVGAYRSSPIINADSRSKKLFLLDSTSTATEFISAQVKKTLYERPMTDNGVSCTTVINTLTDQSGTNQTLNLKVLSMNLDSGAYHAESAQVLSQVGYFYTK